MNRSGRLVAIALVVVVCVAGSARSGPLDDGKRALDHSDYLTAFKLLKPLAEQGNAEAQFEVARLYFWSRSDQAQSAAWAWKAAHNGSAPARAWLLDLCTQLENPIPEVRCGQVISDLKTSAGHGDSEAERQLGNLYLQGWGVSKDAAQGAIWIRKAADQGNSTAQLRLGELYGPWGLGVQEDHAQSLAWFRKAADRGNAQAMRELASNYESGFDGAPKDEARAAAWYRRAADKGDFLSEFKLAGMYAQGRGVPKDPLLAFHWNQQLANQGFRVAQEAIGSDYALGKGVAQDYVQAFVWLDIAAAKVKAIAPGAPDDTARLRDSVASHLNAAELADAKQRSAALEAKLPAK